MGNCGVCIGGADYDGLMEMATCEEPKARKPHRCCECGRAIAIGERYQRWSGKFDGEFMAVKTCLICAEIRTAFTCEGGETSENLWSEMADYVFPALTTANECFKKLSPAAKAFLLDKWRKWKGIQ